MTVTLLSKSAFETSRHFIETRARPLEIAMCRHVLDEESGELVLDALSRYQNADGGFGQALEIDLRTQGSSVIATTHALQIARELNLSSDHELVRRTLAYLRSTFDEDNLVWPIIPASANDAPHAPWWTTQNLAESWNHFRANPTAEIAGYLFLFGVAEDETWRHRVLGGVLDYLAAQPDKMERHELLCFVRLAEMVELPVAAQQKLGRAVSTTVDRELSSWANYGLRPLTAVRSPQSPYYTGLRDSVPENLDYLIREQSADGSWSPTWSWGSEFPEVWTVAKREWQGVLTVDALKTLQAFNRLEV